MLFKLERHDEAFACYDKALALAPDLAGAWLGRGKRVFLSLSVTMKPFLALPGDSPSSPDLAGAWHGRGNVLFDLKRYGEAFACYDKAMTLNHDLVALEGSAFTQKC